MSDLTIKIGADDKEAKSAIAGITSAFEHLKENLHEISEASGSLIQLEALEKIKGLAEGAFEVLKEKLIGSLEAFKEADLASKALTQSLQNQGIFTTELKESYDEYAESVSKVTGFEADQITKAQGVAQAFLGQKPVTEELTMAIADLAQKMGGDLSGAATIVSKAIGNGTGQLLRQGLQFSSTSTEAERYAKTIEFINGKYGGLAAAANTGLGATRGLQAVLKQQSEDLGEVFAPAVGSAIEALTGFLNSSEEGSEEITNFKAAVLAAGLVMTGLGVALPVVAQGVIAVKTAVKLLNLDLTSTKVLLAGLGIGLLLIALTELVIHWEAVSSAVKSVTKGLVEFVSGAFAGLGSILQGVFHFDRSKIDAGFAQIKDAFKSGTKTAYDELNKEVESGEEKQEGIKKKYADKEQALRDEKENARVTAQRVENEVIALEVEHGSDALITLKKAEITNLKALESNKIEEQKVLIKKKGEEIKTLEAEQSKQDLQRESDFEKVSSATKKLYFNKKGVELGEANKKEIAAIKASLKTEEDVEKDAYQKKLAENVKRNNTFLEEQQKYNVAYAGIQFILHSNEVQGVKNATGELTALTNSKQQTLKEIGKAAAITNIVIKTAESAMNIYAGFSEIPIIGPILGVAGAAAAIAYGAEQVGNVQAAATGGLVGGTGFGDKIPFVLEPGELITPRQNFDEVVNSVAKSRSDEAKASPVSEPVHVNIGFDGREAQQVLTSRRVEDKALGVYRART